MAKTHTQYVCQSCGAAFPKWQGQCGSCGAWNSLVEETIESKQSSFGAKAKVVRDVEELLINFPEVKLVKGQENRFSCSIGELDRVLGGGLVPGSVILIGGEPGVGKSTLLTQMVIGLLNKRPEKILYISGEESPSQISLRIRRILENGDFLSTKSQKTKLLKNLDKALSFVTTTDVDEITAVVIKERPQLIVIDSIQSLSTRDLTGVSGSVGQIRECADRLVQVVKPLNIPCFLVGHVTKDGSIAGPKILEHMVDTVLELSGERTGQLRLLRALKNRFGATDEVGVFTLSDYGLREVINPSEFFLENQEGSVAGSAAVCIMEGTRPLLLEVQALVVKSQLAMPRRVGRGIELSRIQVLCAVLQRHGKLPLGMNDVFLSAAGGFRIKEPAVDLGLAIAIASSISGKKLPKSIVFIGEVGLLGEIRSVNYLDRRIKEAKRLGFKRIISQKSHRRVTEVLTELGL